MMTLGDEETIRRIVRQELERFFANSKDVRPDNCDRPEPEKTELRNAYDANVFI